MMSKPPYNVGVGVAAFVCYDHKFVIQLRSGAHGAQTWAPPGGKLDFGETPEQGIAREVLEETELTISDIHYIGFTNDIFQEDDLHYITLWYVARPSTNKARITEPHKCLDQRWVTLDEMPTQLFLPTYNILNNTKARNALKEYLK